MVCSFKIILVFVGEAFCLPFALIELHLIRHATRDTFSHWRRLFFVACGIVIPRCEARGVLLRIFAVKYVGANCVRLRVAEDVDPYEVW